MKHSTRTLTGLLALCLAVPTARAGEVPFGHAEWKASPTDPVGFAGQGNNWFSGATPPTSWGEWTSQKQGKDVSFQPMTPPKNILWKVPVPTWSDSAPVVIGNPSTGSGRARVVSLTSPDYVTCYDADTGQVVWQDRLKIMTLPRLATDRRTLEPAPEPARAAKLQTLFEAAVALYHIGCAVSPGKKVPFTGENMAPREPLVRHVLSVVESWKKTYGAEWPETGPALDEYAATLNDLLAEKYDEQSKIKGGAVGLRASFVGVAERITGVAVTNYWPGHISDTMATPVSDGQIVGVTFGHGQVGAYELATGKRLWAWRDPLMRGTSASHCASPLMWKDLLIFTSPKAVGKPKGNSPPAGWSALNVMAVDKRTGAVTWEVPNGCGGAPWGVSHGDHMSPHLARLSDGRGGIRAVVVTNGGRILDPETGAMLAQLPPFVENSYGGWGSGFVASVGNRVYKCWGGDCSAPRMDIWPLSPGQDKVDVAKGFDTLERGSSHGPFALSDKIASWGRTICDPGTGRKLAEIAGSGNHAICGTKLVVAADAAADRLRGRTRDDRMCLKQFWVYDVADPARPKLLSEGNLIGGPETPTDIADTYFPEFHKPQLKKFGLGCYHGIGAGFGGAETSAVTAHGGRIYIKSNTHLYCIGER